MTAAGHADEPRAEVGDEHDGERVGSDDGRAAGRAPRKRWWLGAAAVVASIVVVITVIEAPQADDDPLLSYGERQAPTFDLPDLSDPNRALTLHDSDRPVVLNIWASWCVPCRREMPVLQAAHRRFGDRVMFIGVNHVDQRKEALEFLSEIGVTYPSGYDPDGSVAADYGVFGLPTTYFITGSKKIVATKTGEIDAEELASQIDRLLAHGR